jgi:hypothetical protein
MKPLFDSEHTDPNLIYKLVEEWHDTPPPPVVSSNTANFPNPNESEWTTEKQEAIVSLKAEIEKMKPHMTIFFNHHDPKEHGDIVDYYNKLYAAVYKEWQKDQPNKASSWEEGEGSPDWA